MTGNVADGSLVAELVVRTRTLYASSGIQSKLHEILGDSPHSELAESRVCGILQRSRAVYFDTHVEVVSGHHTATYLRFESMAADPYLMTLIARDMASWVCRRFKNDPLVGLVATDSDARTLAERVQDVLWDTMPVRLVITPFDRETGKISTDVMVGSIRAGERYVALNDVTTRGNCVSKLGKVATDRGGILAGMMVFARRDSGQFPLMDELVSALPFYYTANLDMPQWEPGTCPLCGDKPLLSWKDIPKL